jgi:hypothetical protein
LGLNEIPHILAKAISRMAVHFQSGEAYLVRNPKANYRKTKWSHSSSTSLHAGTTITVITSQWGEAIACGEGMPPYFIRGSESRHQHNIAYEFTIYWFPIQEAALLLGA